MKTDGISYITGGVWIENMCKSPPLNNGPYCWNFNGTNSLVLLAVANANSEFIMIDFGANGRLSDD